MSTLGEDILAGLQEALDHATGKPNECVVHHPKVADPPAVRRDVEAALAVLAKVPSREPLDGDEIYPAN